MRETTALPRAALMTMACVAIGCGATAGSSSAPPPEPPAAPAVEPFDPGSAMLAFTMAVDGDSEIVLQRGLGSDPERLTVSPGLDLGPNWSPDGEQIYFQSARDGNREVYVINADGSDPRNLSRNAAADLLVDVAPDGRRIAFFSDREVPDHPANRLPGHLYVMDLPDGEPRRVTEEPLTSTFQPDWSPDGGSLLFARDFDGNVDLVVLDLESGEERRLQGTPDSEFGGRFSPDGQQIVFHVNVDGGEEARLVLMNADGSGRHDLTSGAQHYGPAWSPDGRWVIFTGADLGAEAFDLLMVSATGGEILHVTAPGLRGSYADWRPGPR